jgi:hypothetical protein
MKTWVWALGGVALAAGAIYLVRSSFGSQKTVLYKGFTITIVCGGLGPGCVAGWKGSTRPDSLNPNGFAFEEGTAKLPTAEAVLAAAQAKIDTYPAGTTPR